LEFAFKGELAALGTAFCWTITSMSFEAAGRRVGSLPVNLIRLVIALALLAVFGLITRGLPLPSDASPRAWFWLGLSGLVGFSIGDLCLFRAFVLIGARLSMLVFALTPIMTATFGFAFLGERLSWLDGLGMALTIGGVTWVVSERGSRDSIPTGSAPQPGPQPRSPVAAHSKTRGILLGLGGSAGQAAGLVLSKHGMGTYDPFASTQIRVMAGILGFVLIFTFFGGWGRVRSALRHGAAMARISLGATFGPFLGVSLSLIAIQNTATGVAATIFSLVPVIIIVPAVLVFKERVSARAVWGAVVAVVGVALLFLQ
jgi:drug/metabolite transporter (DMT)-like permease